MRSEKCDSAAIAVFGRVQASGKRLTMQVVRDVLAEIDSNASPARVYRAVSQWVSEIETTRILGRR
jgi:Fe2+ or Zn2+ uptake regulation protein